MSEAKPIVAVHNLTKSYSHDGNPVQVLNNLSLDIPEGEFFALLGPSGSGKSTLLNMIGGIDRPDSGTVEVAGTDIVRLDEGQLATWRANHVGFIFQFYNLIPVLTAYENVELPLLLSPLPKKERRQHVETALEVVGLGDRIRHRPNQLSGGQQQRVAIARSLINEPSLLFADEPTGNLDSRVTKEVLAMFDELNATEGITVILVTHDPSVAQHAHRVVRIVDGIVDSDTRNAVAVESHA